MPPKVGDVVTGDHRFIINEKRLICSTNGYLSMVCEIFGMGGFKMSNSLLNIASSEKCILKYIGSINIFHEVQKMNCITN